MLFTLTMATKYFQRIDIELNHTIHPSQFHFVRKNSPNTRNGHFLLFFIIIAVAIPVLPLLLHSLHFIPILHQFQRNEIAATTQSKRTDSILIVIAAVFPTNSQLKYLECWKLKITAHKLDYPNDAVAAAAERKDGKRDEWQKSNSRTEHQQKQ